MPTYDPVTKTYTLTDQEQNYTLQAPDTDASIIGNALDNVLTGNDWSNALDGKEGKDTLIGGKGDDLYVLYDAGAGVVVTELADEGEDAIISHFNIDLKDYANVEHVLLEGQAQEATGNDANNQLYGNDLANILNGGAGNDTLDGGKGSDHLIGGLGHDVYFVDDVNDVIVELAGGGDDTVYALFDYSLVGTELENIELMVGQKATGNDYDNRLTGNAEANLLDGGKGNDILDGGLGADQMIGGLGDDTFVVNDAGDVVVEANDEGIDSVRASISYTLTDYVEFLTLTGSGDIDGTGNDLSNEILGNDHNNILDGKGGNDLLGGLKGDDVYIIDAGDTVVEVKDEGTDTIKITDAFTPNSYTLVDNIENLTVTGTRDFTATGNTLNNLLTGNSGVNVFSGGGGNDTLDGGAGADRLDGGAGEDMLVGGAGDDVMTGGAGNDLYFVDSTGDTVTEDASGGTFDRVIAKISYVLSANVEYLALENAGGNINGTGNDLDNTIFGNDGNNVLDGGAGRDQLYGATGADTVHGGEGDDSIHESGNDADMLYGDAGNDTLTGGGGNDTLDGGTGTDTAMFSGAKDQYSIIRNADGSVTITDMRATGDGTDVLKDIQFAQFGDQLLDLSRSVSPPPPPPPPGPVSLTLIGTARVDRLTGADGNDVLKGLAGNDVLKGLSGNDKLYGGAGKDVLYGGAGQDIFVFDAKFNKKTNLDKIADFNVKDDTLWLENSLFKANKSLYAAIKKGSEAKPAKMASKFFTVGDKAKDANDFFLYDKKTGVLSYDADGSGSKAAVEIATLKKGLKMTEKDFFFV